MGKSFLLAIALRDFSTSFVLAEIVSERERKKAKGQKMLEQTFKRVGGGHSTVVSIHASGSSCPRFDSWHSQKFFTKKC